MEIRIDRDSMIPNQWINLVSSLTTVDPDRVEFIQINVSSENVTVVGMDLDPKTKD